MSYQIKMGERIHTTDLTLDEALKLAFEVGGYDQRTVCAKLLKNGTITLTDDAGTFVIERQS